jgi:formate hydrogenlyase subunit 4
MAALLLMVLTAVLFPGIIVRTKSIASGRKGPGLMQPMKDILVLMKKGAVFSDTTGMIFRLAPAVSLGTVMCSMLLIPFTDQKALISFEGDFVFFAYLLALGRFFMIIGALDTGSSFEGMGANREAFFSMLAEPAFFILIATLAMFTGYTSFSDIYGNLFLTGDHYALIYSVIGFFVFFQIALIENSRMPVDDPKTHLELTMIHEVMILDYCGFDKAMIHIGSYLKFALFTALMFNGIVPASWNPWLQSTLFIIVGSGFAVAVGLMESFRARNKMNKNPKFILSVSALALIGFVVILILTDKLI